MIQVFRETLKAGRVESLSTAVTDMEEHIRAIFDDIGVVHRILDRPHGH